MVIDNLGFGGAQSVFVDYVKMLTRMGHDVTVFNLAPSKTEVECRIPNDIPIEHYNLAINMCATRYYIGVKAYWWGKYVFPFVYMAKKISEKMRKIIFHARYKEVFDIAIAFAGHYNDLTFVAEHFIKADHVMCWTHGALFQNFMTSDGFLDSYLKIKNIIVLNKTAQEEALASNHFLDLENRLNINLLYNPINMDGRVVDHEKVKALRKNFGDFVIMVARIAYPHKDQYTLIRATKQLKEKYGLVKNVVFLGDGPDKENVIQFAKENGMEDQCHFVGEHNDVQNYYSAAHMLVHSSVAFEGFVLTLVEAMYYDIPVISTDTMVGPREVLGSGKYGMLCEVKDYDKMCELIYKLYTDQKTYEHYVNMGKGRKEDFTYEKIEKQLSVILEGLK